MIAALQVASAVCSAAPTDAPINVEFTCKFKPESGEELGMVVWGRPPLMHIVIEHKGHTHVFLTGPDEGTIADMQE